VIHRRLNKARRLPLVCPCSNLTHCPRWLVPLEELWKERQRLRPLHSVLVAVEAPTAEGQRASWSRAAVGRAAAAVVAVVAGVAGAMAVMAATAVTSAGTAGVVLTVVAAAIAAAAAAMPLMKEASLSVLIC